MSLLFIALGGALGAVSRFLLSNLMNKQVTSDFPVGTLSVNVIGSFLIGIAYVYLVQFNMGHTHHKHLFMVGFLGAFTTFSTFSLDSYQLIENGKNLWAICYIGISLLACLLASFSGIALARQFH